VLTRSVPSPVGTTARRRPCVPRTASPGGQDGACREGLARVVEVVVVEPRGVGRRRGSHVHPRGADLDDEMGPGERGVVEGQVARGGAAHGPAAVGQGDVVTGVRPPDDREAKGGAARPAVRDVAGRPDEEVRAVEERGRARRHLLVDDLLADPDLARGVEVERLEERVGQAAAVVSPGHVDRHLVGAAVGRREGEAEVHVRGR